MNDWNKVRTEGMEAYGHWLNSIPGVGNRVMEKLLSNMGTAKAIYEAPEKELILLVGERTAKGIMDEKGREPDREYEVVRKGGISFYPYYHPAYPGKLLDIPDRPFGIYVKGSLPDAAKRSIAIVGARDCSGYGEYVAEKFARELSGDGIQIISGMARGIDGVAGRTALACGGESFAVLGCGVDICYPSSHRRLYQDLCERGGILSSYVPGTQPSPGLFPPRNRIISGLSDVVLVIEARQKSGTLITVDMALEQGREVYVVPGRVTDRLSDGCNNLLLQGAGAAITPEQLIRDLSETIWSSYGAIKRAANDENGKHARSVGKKDGSSDPLQLNEEERELLALMDINLTSLELIYGKIHLSRNLQQLSLPVIMELLVGLSLKGFVSCENGYYRLSRHI